MSCRALGHVDTTKIMKKLTAILMLVATTSFGLDFTYSTNLFYALAYPTNIYIGTNGTDTGGDSFHVWATKINAAHTLLWSFIQTNSANNASNSFLLNNLASLQTNTFTHAITNQAGIYYPSNALAWNLMTITNGLANWAFWEGNSNGLALVTVWNSNGTPIIKQVCP